MRKYLALLSVVLFVLGFVVTSFADTAVIPSGTQAVVAKGETQITIGGELRSRGEYREVDFKDSTPADSYYDSRVRLTVDAKVTTNIVGFIQVEAGGGDTADNYTWGIGKSGAKGIYEVGNAKRGQFNLLQGWILYKDSGTLGVPAGVKVGHMPLALGNKLFFTHAKYGDDAIVFFVDPTKELHIELFTAKFRETNTTDDANAYVGLFAYKGQGFNMSGDVTYIDDPSMDEDIRLWNFGLRGDTKIDSVKLSADIELQSGEQTGDSEKKFKGYAVLAGADAKISGVNVTGGVAYGSGDDDDTDDKIESFVTSLSSGYKSTYLTYVYEYRTPNASGFKSGGLCNTWYIKLGASWDITKEISVSLNAFLLRAVKTEADVDKDIGFELDPRLVYKVNKNLSYYVEGGYLFAGDYWNGGDPNKSVDNAYAIRHGITLSF